MNALWPAGAQVMLRHAVAGRTWALVPVTVLHDTAEATALRISAGSVYLAPTEDGRRLLRLGPARWQLAPRPWTLHDVHYLMPRDRWFALGLLLRPGTAHAVGWYLNFQDPPARRPWGIDTLDLELDMVAPADRHATTTPRWSLKDAARFRALVNNGFFTKTQMRHTVAAVREVSGPGALRGERAELLRTAGRTGPAADLGTAAGFCGALPPDVPELRPPNGHCEVPGSIESERLR
ncbi:DUF402 domain-containing protein [Dactylosporangium sp. NBC_01737]|uniref:DUF402 domain-containing protein n=1 Tax=Dactylosporangium sp. NBC_01737 TaxID=2975959 RepID=UPI002E1529D9|nr:DUF402 domain-containing protein [Dactylosporangium sp. NBC_01737]